MTTQTESLLKKLKALPPARLAEVEDFVDFLRNRETDHRIARAAAQASEPSLEAVWDNPDDAEYDRL